jgi:hypothetical protein
MIKFKDYRSGHKLSVFRISGYYLQWWLCYSSSKIGIFQFFGGVKCASSDSVHHVINYVIPHRHLITDHHQLVSVPATFGKCLIHRLYLIMLGNPNCGNAWK